MLGCFASDAGSTCDDVASTYLAAGPPLGPLWLLQPVLLSGQCMPAVVPWVELAGQPLLVRWAAPGAP